MNIFVSNAVVEQPPVRSIDNNELTVAITSLSLGGAERIVLDWASRIYPMWRVHLIVLFDRPNEWPVPDFVRVTRLHDRNISAQLEQIGRVLAQSTNPLCVCHLFNHQWRAALKRGGAELVTVLHNAKDGWEEDARLLSDCSNVVAISAACARDLREAQWQGPVSIIRHIPPRLRFPEGARSARRKEWKVPEQALVIGMIGAVKPQKNYCRALRVFKEFLTRRDAYLVIIGGPVNRHSGREEWHKVVAEVHRLGLRKRVAMPGFIPGATSCVPAFDVMLNTSDFEGLSIATLEVLVNGMAIVAAKVGGQGELLSEGLTLVPVDAVDSEWADALEAALQVKPKVPYWTGFPSHRLWTLAGLARDYQPTEKTLFVTANLSSGGAQRSLVNLAEGLVGKIPFAISVIGKSSSDYFFKRLKRRGIVVTRPYHEWDAFSFAERLVKQVVDDRIGTICFWNVDPRTKLLVVKSLAHTRCRFVEVSPGDCMYEEMASQVEVEELIAFSSEDYYRRIDQLILKYEGRVPEACRAKTVVIRNGIPMRGAAKSDYGIKGNPRVVVCGRIAPTKFILEIMRAMEIVREKLPQAELHIFGATEAVDREYGERVVALAKEEGEHVFFHGMDFEANARLHAFDAYVVLGKNQGCPNALLEALSAGVPSIANDDGGTCEQLLHNKTGLLIGSTDSGELAEAIVRMLSDRSLAKRLGQAGRLHALRQFSMEQMVSGYLAILREEKSQVSVTPSASPSQYSSLNLLEAF